MEFLYPGFLYALAAICIPILVHLFNFRRFKKIEFTNVRFLKEIKHKTQNQNKLKHLLVLLMRILAIIGLVLAFAQPYFPTDSAENANLKNSVSIFVDNSFSMQGEAESGEMLEVAKNRAIDISGAFSNQDEFQLLTQDFLGQHQHLVSQDVFGNWSTEVDFSPSSHIVSDIMERQSDILLKNKGLNNLHAYIISDFQKTRYNIAQLEVDSSISVSLVHIDHSAPANLYIDSVWFDTPVRTMNGTEKLKIRIANTGSDAVANVPLQLSVNGAKTAIGSFGAEGNSVSDTALYFVHESAGLKQLKVSLTDFPVTYDDTYYLAYDVHETIHIKSIFDESNVPSGNIKAVFQSDSTLNFSSSPYNQLDYANLSKSDLLVINELSSIPTGLASELTTFVRNGGAMWIIPATDADVTSYNFLLNSIGAEAITGKKEGAFTVKSLNAEHPLFKGVFQKLPKNIELPQCQSYYKLSNLVQSKGDQILGFSNGDAFLTSNDFGNGNVYISTSSISDANNSFSRHAIFVAAALRMAELSKSSEPNALTIGTESIDIKLPVELKINEESVVHLVNTQLSTDVIPMYQFHKGRVSIVPGPEIVQSGNYEIQIGDKIVSALGMNYNRAESDLSAYSFEDLKSSIAESSAKNIHVFDGSTPQLKSEIDKQSRGQELWKICLILALAFLLIETLLLRFWKK